MERTYWFHRDDWGFFRCRLRKRSVLLLCITTMEEFYPALKKVNEFWVTASSKEVPGYDEWEMSDDLILMGGVEDELSRLEVINRFWIKVERPA